MSRPKSPALSLRKPPQMTAVEDFVGEKANSPASPRRWDGELSLSADVAQRVEQHCKLNALDKSELIGLALAQYFEVLDRSQPPFDW